jgi:hypothetical protein
MTALPRIAALTLCLVTAPFFVVPARTEDPVPVAYSCTFKAGSALAYAKSVYRSKRAKPIAFDIEAINLDGQKADLISAGGGKGPLRIVRALGANHFLEVVTEGYLNITTVYSKDPKRGTYPAVHSRHFGVFGEPIVAQYTGFCAAK